MLIRKASGAAASARPQSRLARGLSGVLAATMDRRSFLKRSGVTLGAGAVASQLPFSMIGEAQAKDEAAGKIVYKNYCHLGIAADTEKGLIVPVLRDVDRKSVHDIGREMADLAQRGRDGKLTPDEMQGGVFTISNLGGIGGSAFTPIVNWPQVAILGLSRSRTEPERINR